MHAQAACARPPRAATPLSPAPRDTRPPANAHSEREDLAEVEGLVKEEVIQGGSPTKR